MSEPRPVKFTHLPFAYPAVPLDAMHGLMLDHVREAFDRKGDLEPIWLVQVPGRLIWVETPWDDESEKIKSVYVIESMLAELGALSYSFACEAWVSVYSKDEPFGSNEEGYVPPKDRPKDKRDDIVFVSTFERSGTCRWSRFFVSIRHDLPNLLGPRQDDDDEHQMSGLMFNLFQRKIRRKEP